MSHARRHLAAPANLLHVLTLALLTVALIGLGTVAFESDLRHLNANTYRIEHSHQALSHKLAELCGRQAAQHRTILHVLRALETVVAERSLLRGLDPGDRALRVHAVKVMASDLRVIGTEQARSCRSF